MDPIPCGSKQGDENASKKAAAFLIAHELKEKERGQNGKNADESFEMKEIRKSNASDSPSVLILQKEQGFVLIGFIRSAANGVPIVIPVEEGDSTSLKSLDLIANEPGTICIYYESKSRHIELRGRFLDEEYII
ncbi:uncharacterized protein LOC128727093 [Anopheles nili]|uniref:uncharacterized protein LOC128727093 n=1 Tax=Anopheles nili TaxID=185578 RepID=UPI00237BE49D|nr:uncharacterized protein LOC128727093 [Anopheles nili]